MRKTDLDWLEGVIMRADVATKRQRAALVRYIRDANTAVEHHAALLAEHEKESYTMSAIFRGPSE